MWERLKNAGNVVFGRLWLAREALKLKKYGANLEQ
jgi:hypothetical protein